MNKLSIAEKESIRDRQREYGEMFLSLPIEEQARRIEYQRKHRHVVVPEWIVDYVNSVLPATASAEHRDKMAYAMALNRKYPYRKSAPQSDRMSNCTLLLKDKRILKGYIVLDILTEDDTTVGYAVDALGNRLYVVLLNVLERVWTEV